MTAVKTSLAAFPILVCTLLSGCGKTLVVATTPPLVTNGTGSWAITGYYQVGIGIAPYSFGGSLFNKNGQLRGVFHIDQPCFGSGATDVPYTGTLDTSNNLVITSASVDGQVLRFQGTLSTDNSSITGGSFTVTGGCTGSLVSGTFAGGNGPLETTAFRLPALTGSWRPSPNNPGLGISEQLTQSTTPDAHGDYALTGTVTVSSSPCFTHGTLQPDSFISGQFGQQIIRMNDGSTLQTPVGYDGLPNTTSFLDLALGSITGGQCDGSVSEFLQ